MSEVWRPFSAQSAGRLLLMALCLSFFGCGVREPRASSTADLMAELGCGSCHSIAGIAPANSRVGPPLNNYGKRVYIVGLVPNNEENLVQFLKAPESIHPGTAMPNVGLSQEQARDIAQYLYSQ